MIGRGPADKADKRRTIIKLSDVGMHAVENFFETYPWPPDMNRRPGFKFT